MSDKSLIESVQSLGLTNEELADYLGISIDTLKTWLYRKKEIPTRKQVYVLNKISVHPNFKGVNSRINKKLTNEEFISHLPEPIELINPSAKELIARAKALKKAKQEPTSKEIIDDELVDAVEFIVPIKGQAGLASKQYPDEMVGELPKRIIRVKPEYRGVFYTIEVDGNSMPPKIQPKDWLRCEEISSMFWFEKNFFKEKNIYCIWDNERGIIFKRIIYKENELWCSSDNESKNDYPDFPLDLKTVSKILIVRKLIDRNI